MTTGRPATVFGMSSERSRTVMTGIAPASLGNARPAAAAAPVPRKSRRETDIEAPLQVERWKGGKVERSLQRQKIASQRRLDSFHAHVIRLRSRSAAPGRVSRR